MTEEILTSDKPEFWRNRYVQHATPWDLDEPAPPFVSLLASPPDILKPGRLVAPGCGYGHDAALFGRHGYDVLGVDIIPEAIAAANERYGEDARFVCGDFFHPPEEMLGRFDVMMEHTFFCAIPPLLRPDYVGSASRLLRPGGLLVGLFWLLHDTDGPPYGVTRDEIEILMSPHFALRWSRVPDDSIGRRCGEEWLAIFQRHG